MVRSNAEGMPEAVRAQMEALDVAEAEERKQQEAAALGQGNDYPDPDNPATPVVETPEAGAEPIPEGGDNQGEGFDWQAEAAAMKEERDKAAAMYSTLKGKYEAELPRSQAETRTLKEELETLKALPPAVETPTTPAVPEGVDLDQLRADYGDGIVDAMIAMRATNVPAPVTAPPVDADLKARLDKLENSKSLDAEDAMFDAIEKEHKDWKDVNKLAIFHKFLAEVDPNTGETRQTAIDRAHQRLDSAPIIRQLSTFKRRSKKGNAAQLESQVVPGDDGRSPAPPVADESIYSTAKIDLFYKTAAIRISNGKPVTEEYHRLDALYTKAMLEGRVR